MRSPVSAESSTINFSSWRLLWLIHAVSTVFVISFLDAYLLQRKFNFFTGGFLSVHHLEGLTEILVFCVVSVVADFGIIGPFVLIMLWLCSKGRFNLRVSIFLAFVISVVPIIIVNFISYRILDYVGNIFDLPLAFEIASRSISEMASVASIHLVVPVIILTGSAGIIILVIWKSYKRWTSSLPQPYKFAKVCFYSFVIMLISFLMTCISIASSEKLEYGLRRKPVAKFFASIGEIISDIDRDGYGLLKKPKDPDLFDSKVYPYAVEIPDNGIDENGVAGDLKASASMESDKTVYPANWKSRPHIILFVLETFRADLIGKNIDGKHVTPVLNKLAMQGISVNQAFAHIGFTAPSRYQIFTGRLNGRSSDSLIDDFKANGYEVAYFSAQDVSFGGEIYDVGFTRADVSYDARVNPELRYTTFTSPGSIALPNTVIIKKVTDFLSVRESDRPLFLYVNLQDTHFPYYHDTILPLLNHSSLKRSQISRETSEELLYTYLNTASNVDFAVGSILDSVNRYLKPGKPGIIVTADHGESLYDDGFLGHGFVLNDTQTQVPFIVANLPMIIEQPFGLVQLRRTLNQTLEQQPVEISTPVLNDNLTAKVFQYLGNIRRPSQIAFKHSDGRTIYDFRTGRIKAGESNWKLLGELTVDEYAQYKQLVNFWENMIYENEANKGL